MTEKEPITLEKVRIAYKKLKSALFFDKTLLPLRDALVQAESDGMPRVNCMSESET